MTELAAYTACGTHVARRSGIEVDNASCALLRDREVTFTAESFTPSWTYSDDSCFNTVFIFGRQLNAKLLGTAGLSRRCASVSGEQSSLLCRAAWNA